MDLIYTDTSHTEIGYLKRCEIDMELGSGTSSRAKNDFIITIPIDMMPAEINQGSLIYEAGTEFGGIVNGIGADTSISKATIYGTLWRGVIAQKIICPPQGQAYYQARGEANKAISALIDQQFDGLIVADTELSNISVYHDFRYTNLLESLEKMLAEQKARLDIKTVYMNKQIRAVVSAVPVNNYSNEIELSNDYGITLSAKKIRNGVNHVICLGKGELTDRTVIHLYKQENGVITTDPTHAVQGADERVITYDYSSAETEDDLIEGGKKKLTEKCDEESLSIAISANVEIGDIVAARERITGIYMQKAVTQKIAKGYIDRVKIDYKVGE